VRIIQQPKIAVNVFPDEIPSQKNHQLTDIFPNKIVFDSDRLEHDPRPQFKHLSIGDFDLYTATAFLFSNNVHPEYARTEVERNRIDRTFRMRLIGLRDGMSYAEYKKNGNMSELEFLFNVLDNIFGLVNPIEMTQADFGHTSYRIEDMLSYAFRVHHAGGAFKFGGYAPEIGREVAGEDVALILRKMLPRPTTIYDNWVREFRGRRMFVTHEHPELLI